MWNLLYAKCGFKKKTCTAIGETQSNRVKDEREINLKLYHLTKEGWTET